MCMCVCYCICGVFSGGSVQLVQYMNVYINTIHTYGYYCMCVGQYMNAYINNITHISLILHHGVGQWRKAAAYWEWILTKHPFDLLARLALHETYPLHIITVFFCFFTVFFCFFLYIYHIHTPSILLLL